MPDGLVCSKRARWSYRDRFPGEKVVVDPAGTASRRGDLVRVVRRWIEDGDVVVLGIGISSILIGPLIEPHGVVYMWRILGRLRPADLGEDSIPQIISQIGRASCRERGEMSVIEV